MKPISNPSPSKPNPASKPQSGVKIRTTVKAGDPGTRLNHGVKIVAAEKKRGLKIRTTVKAGDPGARFNHGVKIVAAEKRGLKIRTTVKAGDGMRMNHSVKVAAR